jgi:hypothetical protein
MVAALFEGETAAERREALLGHRPGLVENALPEAGETGLQEEKPAVAGAAARPLIAPAISCKARTQARILMPGN